MEKNYSGVSEYTLNLLTEIFRKDQKNKYKLFYNSAGQAEMPQFNFSNVEYVKTNYPNKVFNLILQKLFGYPRLDKMLDVDIFFMPNIGFISLSNKAKKIITIHDLSFLRYKEFFSFKRNLWHKFINLKKNLKKFDYIIAISENTKRDLIELCQVPEEKIKVIYSGIDKKYRVISQDKEKDKFRQVQERYSLPDKFILFLGTIEPRKNIGGLIRSYSLLRDKNPELSDFKLVLAGAQGWKVKEILEEYYRCKYKKDIIFLNYVDKEDKVYLYNLASLFVFPSFYEGFGFPPLEAMACGVPVVSSNVSSLAEVIKNSGILVSPNNICEIERAMTLILRNKNIKDELIMRGLENVKKFSWEECADNYIKFLQNKR
jgi:glycosyltransferase involved in cell wall biosynthesis